MLHTEVGLQADAVRDHHDDQRTEDGIARLAATTEQGRATDDSRRHCEQQDVAGTEVELCTASARREEHPAERSEAGVDGEGRDLDVPDIDARASSRFLV